MSDSGPLHDLTGFQRDLLATIGKLDAPKGLRIKEALEGDYGEEINHGRLYPNLDSLSYMGLVDKSQRDQRTNEYELTPRGRRELSRHIRWLIEADSEVEA